MAVKPLFLLTLTLIWLGTSWAHPGMAKALAGLSSLAQRQSIPETELLADLKTLPDDALSPAGWTIKNILLINRAAVLPQDLGTVYTVPGPLDSPECRSNTCCVWKYIADVMAAAFRGSGGGECNELARQAVRLGFHDAGTWSKTKGGGGADGSIILAPGEMARSENRGLEAIAAQMMAWYAVWHPHGAGMADLIQMAATVAAVSCPLGPRVRSFVGRNDSAVPAPEGRLPDETDDAETLVALFEDKTIVLGELIALVGAHTTSIQRFVDVFRAGSPQDSTPGVWDVLYYNETASEEPPPGVFRFESDESLSRYPPAQEFWQAFANPADGQTAWNNGYAGAYVRLSVLGVEHLNDLKECTGVLP
ncbi:versatile peroxidase VPL1 [Parachaetomium inaequale]|uniref:Peroxidase n=1 Tax=Parachaetomium inaequale TaxID=2588326 RepID=A0AAN6PNF1_9PEZI|nr:versatile peroxidase VPL1 [Parachaetomium inaequale]